MQGADFMLGKSLFGAPKSRMLVLTNIDILDVVLNSMQAESFCYLIIKVLVKM